MLDGMYHLLWLKDTEEKTNLEEIDSKRAGRLNIRREVGVVVEA